jgi:peptidoglycan/LPS O-acetylase OafA/YrhL
MNKEELLQELSVRISTGEISREEIANRLSIAPATQGAVNVENLKDSTPFSVTKMLYVLGATIVVVGIVALVSQIWDDIGSFGRIAVTLGLGFLITAIGSMLLKSKPDENIGTVFHFIGGMLIPGGAVVTLSELSLDSSDWSLAITFGVIFVFYLLLNYVHKNAILTFFAIANGTATVYSTLNAVVGGPFEGWFGIKDIYQYTTMAMGTSYLLLAHAFRDGWNKKLIGVLYFFGITGFLGAAFSQVFDSAPWQMLYFLIVIGGLALSVYMRSRSILVMSTLFLIAHVSYITSEYFADSLGWPISLVILGFVFIGLGYVSISINKKYIAN